MTVTELPLLTKPLNDDDIVLVLNLGDQPFTFRFAGKEFRVEPNSRGVFAPWAAAKLWFGDGFLVDTPEDRARSEGVSRLMFRYGTFNAPFWAESPRETTSLPHENLNHPYVFEEELDLWRHPNLPRIEVRFLADDGWVRVPLLIDPPVENAPTGNIETSNDIMKRLVELERQNRQLQELVDTLNKPDFGSSVFSASQEIDEKIIDAMEH